MKYTQWSSSVNTRFFNYSESYDENANSSEYASGRKTVILKNTRFTKTIKCSISLNVKNGEYNAFWAWYKDSLGGLAGAFTCAKLGGGYFRFKTVPSASSGLLYRSVELEIEEVY